MVGTTKEQRQACSVPLNVSKIQRDSILPAPYVTTSDSLLGPPTLDQLDAIFATVEAQGALFDQLHHQTAPAHNATAITRFMQIDSLINWNTGITETVRLTQPLQKFNRWLYGFGLLHKRSCLEMRHWTDQGSIIHNYTLDEPHVVDFGIPGVFALCRGEHPQ
jgi:hypothetical protein